ncbi:MAG: hypothetical protein KJO54_02105 [Gammaproteobacteria bacterium]|nr:hypothetical protein [Gammaproteobacteria bacterium]
MTTTCLRIGWLLTLVAVLATLQGCAAVAVGAVKTAIKVPVALGGAVVDMAVETDKEKAAKEEKRRGKEDRDGARSPSPGQ